jgi:hypothetical protein
MLPRHNASRLLLGRCAAPHRRRHSTRLTGQHTHTEAACPPCQSGQGARLAPLRRHAAWRQEIKAYLHGQGRQTAGREGAGDSLQVTPGDTWQLCSQSVFMHLTVVPQMRVRTQLHRFTLVPDQLSKGSLSCGGKTQPGSKTNTCSQPASQRNQPASPIRQPNQSASSDSQPVSQPVSQLRQPIGSQSAPPDQPATAAL